MQFLILSRRRTTEFTAAQFDELAKQEADQARRLYGLGFTRQLWHRGDQAGACQIAEAVDEGEVRVKLATLPYAKAGMLDFEIVPLKPYAGFYT